MPTKTKLNKAERRYLARRFFAADPGNQGSWDGSHALRQKMTEGGLADFEEGTFWPTVCLTAEGCRVLRQAELEFRDEMIAQAQAHLAKHADNPQQVRITSYRLRRLEALT